MHMVFSTSPFTSPSNALSSFLNLLLLLSWLLSAAARFAMVAAPRKSLSGSELLARHTQCHIFSVLNFSVICVRPMARWSHIKTKNNFHA